MGYHDCPRLIGILFSCNSLTYVPLTEAVLDRAAQIRRDYRLMLADALIAACALIEECTLVTRNVNDFRRIDSLNILNPFEDG